MWVLAPLEGLFQTKLVSSHLWVRIFGKDVKESRLPTLSVAHHHNLTTERSLIALHRARRITGGVRARFSSSSKQIDAGERLNTKRLNTGRERRCSSNSEQTWSCAALPVLCATLRAPPGSTTDGTTPEKAESPRSQLVSGGLFQNKRTGKSCQIGLRSSVRSGVKGSQ